MIRMNDCQLLIFLAAVALIGFYATDVMAQGIEWEKIDSVGNGFITWFKNNPLTWGFTAAFCITGLMAAFNRAPWWPFVVVIIGAFIAFGSTTFVTGLRSQFG